MKYQYMREVDKPGQKKAPTTFKRINRKQAKELYYNGYWVRLIPRNEAAENFFCTLNDIKFNGHTSFDSVIDRYHLWLQYQYEYTSKKDLEPLFYIPIEIINSVEVYKASYFDFYGKGIDPGNTDY